MLRIRPAFWRRHRHREYSQINSTDRIRKLIELFYFLVILIVAHVVGMVIFEGLSFWDSIWLTLTTLTTVGYGDFHADTVGGRITTILLMYLFGIYLLANIAGEFIDYRLDRRERMRKGLWRWNMKNHIVIINTPDTDGSRYLQTLVEQIRNSASLEDYPIQILSPHYADGLPNELNSLGVVLRQGRPEGRAKMDEVDVENAAFVIVLAVDASDYRSDSLTLDILDQLKQFEVSGYVIAECVQDENRDRLRAHGAGAVLRPVRAYPELLVRAMAAPGTETILEDLFKHEGVHPRRYNLDIPEQTWGKLAARLVLNGLGTPLGYVDRMNNIVTNPDAGELISGDAMFIMVNHDKIPENQAIQRCVSSTD